MGQKQLGYNAMDQSTDQVFAQPAIACIDNYYQNHNSSEKNTHKIKKQN